tara:strand:- start:4725 stop:5126 length:402 start_codon:yes stop_codon:yes gene_type:complete
MKGNACVITKGKNIIKTFNHTKLGEKRFWAEVQAYDRADANSLDFVPTLLDYNAEYLTLTIQKVGNGKLSKRKRERKDEIVELAKTFTEETGLFHNDVRFKNVVVDDSGKLWLIDFETSSDTDNDKNDDKILP